MEIPSLGSEKYLNLVENVSSKSSFDLSKKLSLSLVCISLKRARSSSLSLMSILGSRLRPLLWLSPLSSLPGELLLAGEGGISASLIHQRVIIYPNLPCNPNKSKIPNLAFQNYQPNENIIPLKALFLERNIVKSPFNLLSHHKGPR